MATWIGMELFGHMHIMVPDSDRTLCKARMNMNGEQHEITNIMFEISCTECRKTARVLRIPTAQ